MGISNVISLLGGVALFLFGMAIMGDALKKVAGNKLELILFKLSSTPLKGILLGTGVTAVIQSSSATSVMVVGYVNSGMMKVKQAIGIILGAILGTSVTGWILCLNAIEGGASSIASILSTATITGISALIGIVLRMGSRSNTGKYIGEIFLGFAVLMYGMTAMSGAVAPLKESAAFIALLTKFSNPLIGIAVGIVFTGILQSASAAVGILQALAITGAITFDVCFPLLMGIGIGASVPVLLSSIGASVNGKRTAWIYLVIDVAGAIICGTLFYLLDAIIGFSFTSNVLNMVSIAFLNSLYRFFIVIFLAPVIGLLEKIVCRAIPDDPDALKEQADMDRLEQRFLANPAMAVEQSRIVIGSMAENTRVSIREAINIRNTYNTKVFHHVDELESLVDRYEDKLGNYLMKITAEELNETETETVYKFLHSLADFERLSDHAKNIAEAAQEIDNKKIVFSAQAQHELSVLEKAVWDVVNLAFDSFVEDDLELAYKVEPLEEVIDLLCDKIKANHVSRLQRDDCTLGNGFVFNDLLSNYERIGDHCSNIAISVIEKSQINFNPHEYTENIADKQNSVFNQYLKEFKGIYRL